MYRMLTSSLAYCLILAGTLSAQNPIPNPGFESWTADEPDGWLSSNNFGAGSIVQTSDAHSGSSAVQGNVVETAPGVFASPQVSMGGLGRGIAVSQRWNQLRGYYKYNAGGFDLLIIQAGLKFANGTEVSGQLNLTESKTDYTEFVIDLQLPADSIPDSAYIFAIIFGGPFSDPDSASKFWLDDLSFTRDTTAQSEIPNPGFETWTNGDPDGWLTSNVIFPGSVIQTGDAHAGDWAVTAHTVEAFPGTFVAPYLQPENGFPFAISQQYSSLQGYYKFNSAGGDRLELQVFMLRNGRALGGAIRLDTLNVNDYTEFVMPINYNLDSLPDSALIYAAIIPPADSTLVHEGSQFWLDELAFGGGGGGCPVTLTGDVDGNGGVVTSDIIYLVNTVLKLGAQPLPCAAAGDVNCDGNLSTGDIIYLVNAVLKAQAPPCDVCTLIPGSWSCP